MNSPLNPILYERIQTEFGRVSISQAGMAASKHYGPGMFISEHRIRMELDTAGEYYRISCPFCGDSRGRLWINHLFGVEDEITGNRNLWLAICFNENCLSQPGRSQELYDRLYGFKNANIRNREIVILPGEVEAETLQEVGPPGLLLPLDKLPKRDRVITYLADRNYNINELQTVFNVSYCLNADERYVMAQDRIVIPVYMHEMLVGWQCRYPADLNWKLANIPKYYTRPNMPRRLILYNYDNAVKYPFVVVCEGVTDVWNVGPYAVACFGKHVSAPQLKLLCDGWSDGAIVILLDGDAWDESQILAERLSSVNYKGKIIPVRLPENKDPGSLDINLNAEFIINSALYQNVDLLSMQRNTNDDSIRSRQNARLSDATDRLKGYGAIINRSTDSLFDVTRNS
jgi:hypothetical protein